MFSFVPSSGLLSDQFQIVWLTFTTFDIVDVTTMPADVEQRFEDLKGYGGVLQFPPNYEVLSAVGMPSTVVKPTKGADLNKESSGLHINVDDASNDSPSTYAGKFGFAGYSGNAVVTTFAAGHLSIDPQLVMDGSQQDATASSGVQRKTFYDGYRYWLFWKDKGPNNRDAIKYKSSLDGKNWNPSAGALLVEVASGGNLNLGFTVTNSGNTVVVLWVDGAANTIIKMVSGL